MNMRIKRVSKAITVLAVILALGMPNTGCSQSKKEAVTPQNTPTPTITADAVKPTSQPAQNEATAQPSSIPPVQVKADIASLIPSGWHIIEIFVDKPEKVTGDLNKDGIEDVAVAIEQDGQPAEGASARQLLIFFGNADNTYTLAAKGDKALLLADEGGAFGDPMYGLEINRGSLVVNFYGGSNWRWYCKYRFKYRETEQPAGFYLIGATLGSYNSATAAETDADEADYNLLTGDYIIKKTDEKGVKSTEKGNRGKKKLVRLEDFVASEEKEQF